MFAKNQSIIIDNKDDHSTNSNFNIIHHDPGIYIFWPFPQEMGGRRRKKEKSDKTHVKIPL